VRTLRHFKTLAAALVMTAGMGCGPSLELKSTDTANSGGPKQTSQPPTQYQQPAYRPVSQPPAQRQPPTAQATGGGYYTPAPAPAAGYTLAAKTAAAPDELDMAIRDASDYLNDNIPAGSKIVILNIESNSSNLSEYIIDELIANAINDKKFSVVDRRQLETIQAEQKFQMSGAVDDKDALAIGKFFGAQTIISGAMRDIGGRYRLIIRALAVQTAQVQGQYNRNMPISETLAGLANSTSWSRPASVTTTVTASGRPAQAAPSAPSYSPPPAQSAAPAIQRTLVQGNNLAVKLKWLKENAESGVNYLIELNANETIAPETLSYNGKSRITITLAGVGANRGVFLSANGSLFTVGADVTLVLENNVTLQGRGKNTKPLVHINGGALKMNAGSAITGNTRSGDNTGGGGVRVDSSGTVTMNGGKISENTATHGGGIYISAGTFTMNDGVISSNIVSSSGGGVYLEYNVTFNMNSGTISDNTANVNGGGVYVHGENWAGRGSGTFNMRGGNIVGNTAGENGGGVCSNKGTFNMGGGSISGNTAGKQGGGVWTEICTRGAFNKGGGTIIGSNDANNGNRVLSAQKGGHAVYSMECGGPCRKETTAGPSVNLSGAHNCPGGWDKGE